MEPTVAYCSTTFHACSTKGNHKQLQPYRALNSVKPYETRNDRDCRNTCPVKVKSMCDLYHEESKGGHFQSLFRPIFRVGAVTNLYQCDRTRPACSQCIQSGWQCPGYVKTWKKREIKSRKTRPRCLLTHALDMKSSSF